MRSASSALSAALVAVICVIRGTAVLAAQDWPEFRGPDGQGHSAEIVLPLEWSETRNIAWKTPLPGLGWSSPVVAGGRVWITTAVEQRGVSLRAMAFDVATGTRGRQRRGVSHRRLAREINPKNSWASPTPIVDGDRVYVHFGADGTAALTTGRRDRLEAASFDYQSQHGAGGSPVLYGDLLIFSCDGSDARVRGRARQAHRQGEVEDQPPRARRSGVHDAAGDPGRRSRSARQRRRVSRRGLRSADRQGDLARQLRRRLLQRAAAGVRPRPGLHRHRIPAAVDDRRPRRMGRAM